MESQKKEQVNPRALWASWRITDALLLIDQDEKFEICKEHPDVKAIEWQTELTGETNYHLQGIIGFHKQKSEKQVKEILEGIFGACHDVRFVNPRRAGALKFRAGPRGCLNTPPSNSAPGPRSDTR